MQWRLIAEVTNTNGEGEVTITLGATPMSFQLRGIRVDASRLAHPLSPPARGHGLKREGGHKIFRFAGVVISG